jgi:hypothetical protein
MQRLRDDTQGHMCAAHAFATDHAHFKHGFIVYGGDQRYKAVDRKIYVAGRLTGTAENAGLHQLYLLGHSLKPLARPARQKLNQRIF